VCPVITAWELAQRLPEAQFKLVTDAGHTAYEPGITHELVTATDHYLAQSRGKP
jgi:proline iminopeptidase